MLHIEIKGGLLWMRVDRNKLDSFRFLVDAVNLLLTLNMFFFTLLLIGCILYESNNVTSVEKQHNM